MNILDISLNKINILDPKLIDDKYLFQIQYDNSNNVLFQTTGRMVLKPNHNFLNIVNKNDLLLLHNIYNYLINYIFSNQQKWFENEFTNDELKEMFVNILVPNIEMNCLDLKCNLAEFKNNTNDEINIIPLFRISNILFNGKKFSITLDLADYQVLNNVKSSFNIAAEIKEDFKCFKGKNLFAIYLNSNIVLYILK